jgi:polyprenyl P-hydroxybenzoate/phenylacrylic acid decarboxylase-like protein
VYGIRALQTLRDIPDIETHLVLSPSAKRAILEETDWDVPAVEALADVVHSHRDIGAAIASGSFQTMGMLVAPCSIKSLSGIVNSYSDNLLTRAAVFYANDSSLTIRRALKLCRGKTVSTALSAGGRHTTDPRTMHK